VLLPDELPGISEIVRPAHADVANAIGAAIAEVGGEVDQVYMLGDGGRERAIGAATDEANRRAVAAGADPATLRVLDVQDIPLAYMDGSSTRIRVRVVGDLRSGEGRVAD
jgi:hypothetical protein